MVEQIEDNLGEIPDRVLTLNCGSKKMRNLVVLERSRR
jgi:hypothetical protein